MGYAQPSPSLGFLLKSEIKQTGEYYFYIFEEQSVVLYEINIHSEYKKIWEYKFLKDKNIEPASILYGDITGNGEKELIVVIYIFGQETEVYIFPTDDNIPISAPSTHTLTALKKGSRPMQAALIALDEDKDKEIVIAFCSPERKIILLDYNINKLVTLKDKVAEKFMSNTYGPIKMAVTDYDNDLKEDLVLYTTTENPQQHIYFPNTKKEITKTISTTNETNIAKIKFNIPFENKNTHLIISKKGKIYNPEDKKKEILLTDTLPKDFQTIDLLGFSNNIVLRVSDKNISQVFNSEKTKNKLILPNKAKSYIYNLNQNIILFYNNPVSSPKLLLVKKEMSWKNLIEANPPQNQITQNKKTIKQPPEKRKETTFLEPRDTLYINIGDTLFIPIKQNKEENIHSVETTILPQGMFLDPEKLAFIWNPTNQDIGEHVFEYNMVNETEPQLQINKEDSLNLSLQRVSQTTTQDHKHIVIVNDMPVIQIENNKDTINVMGSFSTNYTIQDQIKKTDYNINIIQPPNNTVLIDNETIYWEPNKKDVGQNEFVIQIDDGFSKNIGVFAVFVDTTIKIKKEDIITTLNKEFVYQLPYQPGYQYNSITAPPNLRISDLGAIHWIPLPTQVDENIIEIDINTGSQINRHRLNVYVNAPPVISYRPAYKEQIARGDTFVFMCQSFDLNTNPTLNWELRPRNPSLKEQIFLSETGQFKVITDSLLDNQDYTIVLSDGIDTTNFFGTLYINSAPKIISVPPNYLILGDTLAYQIEAQDLNKEKPFSSQHLSTSSNIINYTLLDSPNNATLDTTGFLYWIPSPKQLGSHSFDIEIGDSLTSLKHEFNLFVNDKPSIISVDSLSILVGDTLQHFFDAADMNGESNLIYSIKTTIDQLIFSGREGKLTWVPQKKDLGLHTLEISVSDGFSLSTDTQKLKIFVYLPPRLNNLPDSTAYANLQYTYSPKAYDMYKDSTHNQDIFITFIPQDSSFTGQYNSETNLLSWIPSIQDLGLQRLEFIIKDKYNITNHRFYDINVLISPCETLDTLYINTTDTVYIEKESPIKQTITIKTKSPFSPFP